MSVLTAVVAGAVVGVRHAFEADHLAAIATLVRDREDGSHPGRVGASWGVGHSLPVVALGLLLLVAGVTLPEAVTAAFEALVGVVLVVLGVRMLLEVVGPVVVERHDHDDGRGRGHGHEHEHGPGHGHEHEHGPGHGHGHGRGGPGTGERRGHLHLRIGRHSLGYSHQHVDGPSFLVGVLHGLAGSGILVIVLASAAPTLPSAVAFLAAFSALSIVTMGTVSYVWGRSLEAGLTRYLKATAGLVGIGVGLLLLGDQLPHLGIL